MGYAAEALVSAPPPPSKPAAAKTAPRAEGPSFNDHLATETAEPSEAAVASPPPRADSVAENAATPNDVTTEEPSPDQSVDAPPQMIQHVAPTPTPIATPVMVQLIASDALPVENTAPTQAAPVAPDAPPPPQAPVTPPAQNAAPAIEPAAPLPTQQASGTKTEAAPVADAKPHEKRAAPETAPTAMQPVTEASVETQTEAQPTKATPEPAPTLPHVVVAPAPAVAPTRPANAKVNTEISDTSESALTAIEGETPSPAPIQNAAPRPATTDAPVERAAPETPQDDASVQEKFAAALEKTSRGEAKANVERAPAANVQAAAADPPPALIASAAPESMSATPPINALSAASTHAAAQTQALNADHVSRAAPASTQVAQEIVRRFDGGNTKFELRLDPPELGRVEVRLEVTRDHKVTAVVAADSPQALTELARHARELEQSLQSAGLELTENGLSFDLKQSREDAQDSSGDGRNGRGGAPNDETPETTAPLARPIGLERWRGVRVDVMA